MPEAHREARDVDAGRATLSREAADLATRKPWYSRQEIDTVPAARAALRGREIAYVADPLDALVLHIQGSGRVVLPNGEMLRVGYAGQNGRSYVSIGRVLIDRGDISRDQMSMQSLRAWLGVAGYDRAVEVFRANPSYVFFRFVDGLTPDQGPIGAMGVPLTPRRSVAVDRSFIPLGLPMANITLRQVPRGVWVRMVGVNAAGEKYYVESGIQKANPGTRVTDTVVGAPAPLP